MKKLVLMLGVFLGAVSPFSLNAFDVEELQDFNESNYSAVLGSEAFVNYTYDVMDRLFDIFMDFDEELREIVTIYPEDPASIKMEEDLNNLSRFFAEKEKYIRLIPFVFFGIYKGAAYENREMLSHFQALQNSIFRATSLEISCLEAYQEAIDDDVLEPLIMQTEESLIHYMHTFCALSEEAFFTQDVKEFLGEHSNRLHALSEALGVDFDEDEDDEEESEVEQAFLALAEDYLVSFNLVVEEFVSSQRLEKLTDTFKLEIGSDQD